MRYLGSKRKLAKYLLPLILDKRRNDQYYVEPFLGGANMMDKVSGLRIGADIDEDLIMLFLGLQNGFVPPDSVSEEEYQRAKYADRSPLRSFIGIGCSYGGKWFGGYARGGYNKNGMPRNYCSESKRNLMKQRQKLDGVIFIHSCYTALSIPAESIIYCDPPYANTTQYKTNRFFSHEQFWNWCRERAREGHKVFVSEYSAPDDFTCIFEQSVTNSLTKDTGSKKGIERLFIHRNQSRG